MKITKNRLRKIIKEELLIEIGLHDSPIDDRVTQSIANLPTPDSSTSLLVAEILLGFTPAGVAIDLKDLATAIQNRDPALATMAGIGFVPIVGDLFKAPYKAARHADQVDILNDLARGPNGSEGLEQLRRQGANATRAGTENILGISRATRSTIETAMSRPGIYRVHVIIPTREIPLDSFIDNGLAIKPGRATTGSVDSVEDFLNPKTIFGRPLSPGSGSAQSKRVLIRYPSGKTMMDVAEEFDWSEIQGFRARTMQNSRITHRIPPEYIVGIVDPKTDSFIKGLGY